MRYPWANILLIVLVVAELITGYLGLTHSQPAWFASMHVHRIMGFAILALFVWKSRNILGSVGSAHNWRVSGRAMLPTCLSPMLPHRERTPIPYIPCNDAVISI